MPTTTIRTTTRTTITTRPTRTEPRRLTMSVPLDDEDFNKWWAAQVSPSASTRLLVRQFVAEHGHTDAVAAALRVKSRPAAPAPAPQNYRGEPTRRPTGRTAIILDDLVC